MAPPAAKRPVEQGGCETKKSSWEGVSRGKSHASKNRFAVGINASGHGAATINTTT